MASETKIGLFFVLILLGGLGFLVHTKMQQTSSSEPKLLEPTEDPTAQAESDGSDLRDSVEMFGGDGDERQLSQRQFETDEFEQATQFTDEREQVQTMDQFTSKTAHHAQSPRSIEEDDFQRFGGDEQMQNEPTFDPQDEPEHHHHTTAHADFGHDHDHAHGHTHDHSQQLAQQPDEFFDDEQDQFDGQHTAQQEPAHFQNDNVDNAFDEEPVPSQTTQHDPRERSQQQAPVQVDFGDTFDSTEQMAQQQPSSDEFQQRQDDFDVAEPFEKNTTQQEQDEFADVPRDQFEQQHVGGGEPWNVDTPAEPQQRSMAAQNRSNDAATVDPFESVDPFQQPTVAQNEPGDDDFAAQQSFSDDTSRRPGANNVYIVQSRDSYWTISHKVYGSSRYFRALEQYNRRHIPSAQHMQPGMKVRVPDESVLRSTYPDLFSSRAAANQAFHRQNPGGSHEVQTAGFFRDADGHPMFRVRRGDTLTAISQNHLGRSSRSIQVYELNKRRIPNPNNLTIGTELLLPADASKVEIVPNARWGR